MKRILIFFILLCALLFPVFLFAQSVQIIDVQGQILVKKDGVSPWQKAEINMILGKEAEIMSQDKSNCTLAFDEEKQNILTIKENSHIKIENISPGDLFLSEGRVFSLIKNLTKTEKFQIRTPVAVAGARATGWATGYHNGVAFVYCFEDTVYILGMDEAGNITKAIDLQHGFSIDIGTGGKIGKILELTADELAEWNDFKRLIERLSGKTQEGGTESREGLREERNGLRDLRREGREDYREQELEERRQEEEKPYSPSVNMS